MKNWEISRGQFLRFLASLPLFSAIGLDSKFFKYAVSAEPRTPEESLKKLIFLFGPWSEKDRKEAEDFADRFLAAKHAVAPYLPGSNEWVQSLANRFPADTVAVNEINLRDLPAKERELLIGLINQLYSFIEVRFIVSKEPPWGECLGDLTRHTLAPT